MITHGMIRVAVGWLESKHVNDSAVTATVTMVMNALRHNNIQNMVTKYKSDVNPITQLPRDTSWIILMPMIS